MSCPTRVSYSRNAHDLALYQPNRVQYQTSTKRPGSNQGAGCISYDGKARGKATFVPPVVYVVYFIRATPVKQGGTTRVFNCRIRQREGQQ